MNFTSMIVNNLIPIMCENVMIFLKPGHIYKPKSYHKMHCTQTIKIFAILLHMGIQNNTIQVFYFVIESHWPISMQNFSDIHNVLLAMLYYMVYINRYCICYKHSRLLII